MIRQSLRRSWLIGTVAVGLLLVATSAFAQAQGSLRGLVVDEAGKPVPEAEIVLNYVGDVEITVSLKTNVRGEFTRAGLRTGEWKMQATKGTLVGSQTVKVVINEMTRLEALVIKPPAKGGTDTSGMTPKEIEARNKLMAALQADYEAAVASIATDPDGAIAKLTQVASQVPGCAICYSKIGDANIEKNDQAAAEAAYKEAIAMDPKLPDPYSALAILYNQQKKFDDASTMSQKANELLGATTPGGDPAMMYNQGIIYWNAGKYPEAKAEFEKTVKADPKMAEAFFRLGMACVNLGQLPDAVKALEEYLKLSPTGENAEMAKAILKSIK